MIEARDYASDEDLRAMQGLLQELWAIERERTLAHIGDLAWGMAMHVNGVGEFEPVGTHPSYQRRGLGRAICSHALGRLHEEGARRAIVYAATDETCTFYEAIGFRRHTTVREVRKERS